MHNARPSDYVFSNRGPITFNIWRPNGLPWALEGREEQLTDGYYARAACAIIMFDWTSRASYIQQPTFPTGTII